MYDADPADPNGLDGDDNGIACDELADRHGTKATTSTSGLAKTGSRSTAPALLAGTLLVLVGLMTARSGRRRREIGHPAWAHFSGRYAMVSLRRRGLHRRRR